jgi:hypothetical protein
MSAETPREGDKVRTTYTVVREGTVTEVTRDGAVYVDGQYMNNRYKVDILERADDPSKDPVGTIRAELDDSAVYVKTQDGRWTTVNTRNGTHISFAPNELGGTKVLGTVLGTPVAEKVEKLEYEYYRGKWDGLVWRIRNDVVEKFANGRWQVSDVPVESVTTVGWDRLGSKPADVT